MWVLICSDLAEEVSSLETQPQWKPLGLQRMVLTGSIEFIFE